MSIADEFEVFRLDLEASRGTEFALDNFQTGSEPTLYGQYLATNRRLQSCMNAMIECQCELAQINEDLDLSEEGSGQERRLIWRQAKTLSRAKQIRGTFARLFTVCRALRGELPNLHDSEVVRGLEQELHTEKVKEQLAFDLFGHGRITYGTLRALMAVPKAERMRINEALKTDKTEFMNQILQKECMAERLRPLVTDKSIIEELEQDGTIPELEEIGALPFPIEE